MLLLLAACSWFAPAPPADAANVLVLLIDDIGVDKVGVYGSDYAAHTPTLDALAAEGLRFDNAYSAPLCSPARAQLLTGRHARRTGIGTITERDSNDTQLSTDAVLIPEVLRHARGATWQDGAVGKWHLAGVKVEDWPTHPLRSGFQWFAGVRGNPEYRDGRKYEHWSRNLNGTVSDDDRYLTVGTTDDALLRIGQMQEPWFLYVAYNAAHVPIHDPPASLRPAAVPAPRDGVDRHDTMIAVLDAEIGRLLASMDPGVRARTTVIALGDNGSSRFGLRNGQGPGRQRIKHSVFEGGVRVPLIVTGPLVARPGTTTPALVHITDLFPTMAELAGVPVEDGVVVLPDQRVAVDGRSLLPILRGETDQGHPTIYGERFEPNGPGPYRNDIKGVRNQTHRLIVQRGKQQLYRLDPNGWWEERRDLLATPGALEPRDEAALADLRAALKGYENALVYEGR